MKLKTIKSYDILASMRMDGSFHLSDTVIIEKIIDKIGYQNLSFYSERIFTAGRNKRVYTKNDFGYPYLSNSDVISQYPFLNCKFNSKKYGYDYNSLLQEGMIVTGRVGAIGQTAYITSEFEERKSMGSDNIIRIVPKDKSISGFLYAYLASRIGKTFLWKHATGGVQPYINEEMVGSIPVPTFPEDKQLEIHNLIVESAELRVEANKLQLEAIELFEKMLPAIGQTKQYVSTIGNLSRNNLRFDASTNFTNIELFYNKLSGKFNLPTIEELSEKVFTPNIFKRLRVDNPVFGIPFLSGSDLLDAMPTFNSFLSKRMKNIDDYILRNGWIAIQDAGTIGYITLVNGYLDGVAATNNLVRIVPKKTSANYYIYAFLKTQQGQAILKSYEYGSVQKHIDNNQVSQIKIPILPEYEVITNKMSEYLSKTTEACNKENQAIQLVENEIEQWQH